MNLNRWLQLLFLLTWITIQAKPVFPQQQNQQLTDDIEIMETILNKLFSNSATYRPFQKSPVSGYYLENYGVLFKAPGDNSLSCISEASEDQLLFVPNGRFEIQKKVAISNHGKRVNVDSAQQVNAEQTKSSIIRFLGDYSSSMREIKPDQWIMVVVDFSTDHEWFSSVSKKSGLRKLIAKAKMKDLTAYRTGKIDRNALINAISFESRTNDSKGIDEDIEVFADIINSSVEKSQIDGLHLLNKVNGFYLNGYGAVFMLDTQMFPNHLQIITKRLQDGGAQNITIDQLIHNGDSQFDSQASIDALQDRMLNVLSRFGHTIRNLNSNDWVEITVSIDDHSNGQDISRMIMRVNKNDIERGAQQRMDEKEFRKMIRVVKY
jgi:tRNA (Thr-GGU) A37 N-methylase